MDRGTEGPTTPPWLVQVASCLSFFGEKGKFSLGEAKGWRPPRHALGHPTSCTTLCATSRTERFRWRKGTLSRVAGAAGRGDPADSRALAALKAPRARPGKRHPPEGGLRRKSGGPGGLCLLNVAFLSPSHPLLLLPSLFLSNRSLFMIAWISLRRK